MATARTQVFSWVLIEKQGALAKWLGGNGKYGSNVYMYPKRSGCDYTIWKNRPRHKDGALELHRGYAVSVYAAKRTVEHYLENLK